MTDEIEPVTVTVTDEKPVVVVESAATFVATLRVSVNKREINCRFVMIDVEGTQLQSRNGEKVKLTIALDAAQALGLIANLPESIADYWNSDDDE